MNGRWSLSKQEICVLRHLSPARRAEPCQAEVALVAFHLVADGGEALVTGDCFAARAGRAARSNGLALASIVKLISSGSLPLHQLLQPALLAASFVSTMDVIKAPFMEVAVLPNSSNFILNLAHSGLSKMCVLIRSEYLTVSLMSLPILSKSAVNGFARSQAANDSVAISEISMHVCFCVI